MLPDDTLKAGDKAEKIAYDEFTAAGWKCRYATKEEQNYGIDIIAEKDGVVMKIDAKNTFKIFLGNTTVKGGEFKIRHPFRSSCEATHYYIYDRHGKKCHFLGTINDYLLTYFFKDEDRLKAAKQYLSDVANRIIKLDDNKFKGDFFKFVKPHEVHINYKPEINSTGASYYLKLIALNAYEKKFGVSIYS